MFRTLDTLGDNRLSLEEFKSADEYLKKLGLDIED